MKLQDNWSLYRLAVTSFLHDNLSWMMLNNKYIYLTYATAFYKSSNTLDEDRWYRLLKPVWRDILSSHIFLLSA